MATNSWKDRKGIRSSGVALHVKEKFECIEVSYAVSSPVLLPTIQKRHGQTADDPQGSREDDQRAEELALQGKMEGVRSFLPAEEKAQKGPHQSIPGF